MTVHPTPNLTAPQPPGADPVCGTELPSMPGTPCGEPAAWHIRWDSAPSPAASLACPTHMDLIDRGHVWYERHPAGPACSAPAPTWHPDHCTTA